MKRVIGYGVESDFEGGFLVEASPSLWHYSVEAAIRYETPAQAWAAANRRQHALAAAIEIIQEEDGSLTWEPLTRPSKAEGGSWVVSVKLKPEARTMYVVSGGKRVKLSTERIDGKGYKLQSAAEKLARDLTEKGMVAKAEQITAEVVPIR